MKPDLHSGAMRVDLWQEIALVANHLELLVAATCYQEVGDEEACSVAVGTKGAGYQGVTPFDTLRERNATLGKYEQLTGNIRF